jgi:hypothetical protein
VGRLMAAFASRGQGVSREADAVALLSAGLGSQQLLAEGRLAEYNGCLSCVLEACPKLPPSAVGCLLACFDLGGFSAALLHRGTPESISDQVPPLALSCFCPLCYRAIGKCAVITGTFSSSAVWSPDLLV